MCVCMFFYMCVCVGINISCILKMYIIKLLFNINYNY